MFEALFDYLLISVIDDLSFYFQINFIYLKFLNNALLKYLKPLHTSTLYQINIINFTCKT